MSLCYRNFIFSLLIFGAVVLSHAKSNKTLLIFSVGTEVTDGYSLYLRSLKTYGLKLQGIFAQGLDYSSHSVKVNLFNEAIEKYKDENDTIILFTDSYDVLFTAGEDEIIAAFEAFNAGVVFSAESNCSPAQALKRFYPKIKKGYRFLNSGGFIGYSPVIYDMLPLHIDPSMDDQLFYTLSFLDKGVRASLGIVLDTQATIFQSLHEAADHVTIDFSDDDARLVNHYTNTTPIIIHGNGFNGKIIFQTFSSYLAKSWTPTRGCMSCEEGRINLANLIEDEYPTVYMAVFIERPSPFLKEKLSRFSQLSYPKKKMYLFVYNKIPIHEKVVQQWMKSHTNNVYIGVHYVSSSETHLAIGQVRNMAIQMCTNSSSDLFFSIDSEVNIENLDTLNLLVSYNRSSLAPLMVVPGTSLATFWGAFSKDFKFAEGYGYKEVTNNSRRGIWSVPQISHIYTIRRVNFHSALFVDFLSVLSDNADVAISMIIRKPKFASMFLFVTNLDDYGYLSNMDNTFINNSHIDMWQGSTNPKDWEEKFINPQFQKHLEESFINEMVCPDVFIFPIFTEVFCEDMIEIFEDELRSRTKVILKENGRKNILSNNIFLEQIGFQSEWSFIVQKYLRPVAEKIFQGYRSKGEPIEDFLVRRSVEDNRTMDAYLGNSSLIVSVSLNNKSRSYKGGSTTFARYNCTVDEIPVGWAMIHPGRLTHFHRTHPVTDEVKYNLITYLDP